MPRLFGGHSYIEESYHHEEWQLPTAVLTGVDTIQFLEVVERRIWAERYPNLQLDHDLLLKEVQRTVQISSGGTSADRDALQQLGVLHRLRRERTINLGGLEAGRVFNSQLPQANVGVDQLPGSRFWAVIIGINIYDDLSIPRLKGCVTDALAMHAYLTQDIRVPADHICLLTQSPSDLPPVWAWPTRQNILSALYTHLRDNPHIRAGDNILIYFSGHGSAYYASDAFSSPAARVGSIEALCPSDRGTVFSPDRPDPEDIVSDISDREINVFLGELRDAQGPTSRLSLTVATRAAWRAVGLYPALQTRCRSRPCCARRT
ncbi:hypothetical protein EWM64_g5791 [Hericium alpestre]|uniref:Peptidase C14 caspase domain-containing protein n=1 Tax=Hericium alpestre TaxID=135208 RepID=A0A4Y9ZXL7_9AGAM|nr:hypothetical protein EWM64_g5791 [Hericium alpestre]